MKFKEPITFIKSFTYDKYTITEVPFNIRSDTSEPIEEDLTLSGPVMLRLFEILNHMKRNDLLVYNYNVELVS